MIKRVIFVGMHNKPGLPPLCSTTKSGMLIDRVIEVVNQGDFYCEKSNLFDLDYWPGAVAFNFEWATRVDYNSDCVIVALGASVQQLFQKSQFKYLKAAHPSAIWSNEQKNVYVERVSKLIKNYET